MENYYTHGMSLAAVTERIGLEATSLNHDVAETMSDFIEAVPGCNKLPLELLVSIADDVRGMYARDEHNALMELIVGELRVYVEHLSERTLERLGEDVAYGDVWAENAIRNTLRVMQDQSSTAADIAHATEAENEAWILYEQTGADYNAYYSSIEHLFDTVEHSMYWTKPRRWELQPRADVTRHVRDGLEAEAYWATAN